jgi:chemotaxis protein MotA
LTTSYSFTLAALLAPAFFDPFSLSLTLGGAVGVTCFSYSRKQLRDLLLAIRALIVERESSLQDHIDELRRLMALFRLQGLKGLENQERHLNDLFLRQGVELLVDLQNEETIRARMEQRFNCFLAACEINRQILATLGRLLPSFGLIGTLIGMVLRRPWSLAPRRIAAEPRLTSVVDKP